MTVVRPVVLRSQRIYFSHFVASDVPLLAQWFSQLETTAYLGMSGRSFTLTQEQEWFDNYVKHSPNNQHFAIMDSATDQPIGSISLMDIRRPHNRAELGIAIGDQNYWGRGYGREAIRLMCDYGFTFLDLHTIYLWYVSFNERGRRSYEAAGFKETGRIPEGKVFNGQYYDDVLMSITRRNFGPTQLAGQFGQLPI